MGDIPAMITSVNLQRDTHSPGCQGDSPPNLQARLYQRRDRERPFHRFSNKFQSRSVLTGSVSPEAELLASTWRLA